MASFRIVALLLSLASVALLAACEERPMNVNLHGVNYSGQTFSYAVADPATPDKLAGGELIDPFGAGGTTCCAALPKVWRSGIKLQVHTKYWTEDRATGKISEFDNDAVVDVPPYVDGKPGELWVLREADGGVNVISSDFQPDHPKWPGKVKGWPVPSLAYQRERWSVMEKHQQAFVNAYFSLLKKLKESPREAAKEAWERAKQDDPSCLSEFSGPGDQRYIASLEKEYKDGLEDSLLELNKLKEIRP
jgi:hypothetical protein